MIKILDSVKARALNIHDIEETDCIAIDTAFMPDSMNAEEYISFLKSQNIISDEANNC